MQWIKLQQLKSSAEDENLTKLKRKENLKIFYTDTRSKEFRVPCGDVVL